MHELAVEIREEENGGHMHYEFSIKLAFYKELSRKSLETRTGSVLVPSEAIIMLSIQWSISLTDDVQKT